MQLSPLQSRLAASLAASLVILLLYLLLFAPSAALAIEVGPAFGPELAISTQSFDLDIELRDVYEPGLNLFDRSIIGRVPAGVTPLDNNKATTLNILPGTSACFIFDKNIIFSENPKSTTSVGLAPKRATEISGAKDNSSPSSTNRTVYLSANTCLQPHRVSPDPKGSGPPQLSIYVSVSSKDGCFDLSKKPSVNQTQEFNQGAVTFNVTATDSVFVSIIAPNITKEFDGIFNFEVAASTDEYYHQYDSDGQELLWIDSDATSALLMTKNFTQDFADVYNILQEEPPYSLYIENQNNPILSGVLRSACGLNTAAQIASKRLDNGQLNNNDLVRTKMTTKGQGNWPKQQFYFEGLNSSSTYSGILVKPANKTAQSRRQAAGGIIGGGGTVFPATTFETTTGTNCKLITDLEFCTDVQWAVPGNDALNNSALAKVYDGYAKSMYAYFENVMMQIPCEAPAAQQYSLVRNCDSCRLAYKQWLCAVSIPRCEDFLSDNNFTIVRNAGQPFPNGTKLPDSIGQSLMNIPASNSSRNSFIDSVIAPGPYKEILPCEDICYNVVQSCPAAIGFACPQPQHIGFNVSYGRLGEQGEVVACNYPGIPRTKTSGVRSDSPRRLLWAGFAGLSLAILLW